MMARLIPAARNSRAAACAFRRQHLVLRDQRAIHVGEQQGDVGAVAHLLPLLVRHLDGRHERPPSRCSKASAASGPSVPDA